MTRGEHAFKGNGEFKFALVNSNGSINFWSNDGTGEKGGEPASFVDILVHEGWFSVVLGDTALPNMIPISPLVFTHPGVALRVWFREAKHDEKRDFELLAPDQRITAVGYAMFAANVPDGSITAAKLASNAVGAAVLAPGSVGSRHLADGAVTASKLGDASVTTSKLAANAVTSLQLADGAVTQDKLAAASVGPGQLANQAVGSKQLAAGSVTRDKLAPDAFPPAGLEDGAVRTRHLSDGAVTSSKLASGSVSSLKLSDGAVTTSKLVVGAVENAQLGYRAVTRDKLGPGSVGPEQLASGAALANLNASGQHGVASGGMVLSLDELSSPLASAGYVRSGSFALTPERWETWPEPGNAVLNPHIAVWTGTQVIVGESLNEFRGARFDPRTLSWRPISSTGAPSFRAFPTFLWTGRELIVWSGYENGSGLPLSDGFLYDPAADRWRAMERAGAPTSRTRTTAVWTGSEMLVWGGRTFNGGEPLNTGGRYDPLRNQWRPIATANSPTARFDHTAVWTGEEMIVWGGAVGVASLTVFNTGGRYRPSRDTWSSMPLFGAPPAAAGATAIWTGTELIVWGGGNANNIALRSGGRFNPANNLWKPMTLINAPSGRAAHSAVWTGQEMIVWGGADPGANNATGTGGRYNPATDEWFPLTTDAVPLALYEHTAFWLGDGMLVVGGGTQSSTSHLMPFWRPAVRAYLYRLP